MMKFSMFFVKFYGNTHKSSYILDFLWEKSVPKWKFSLDFQFSFMFFIFYTCVKLSILSTLQKATFLIDVYNMIFTLCGWLSRDVTRRQSRSFCLIVVNFTYDFLWLKKHFCFCHSMCYVSIFQIPALPHTFIFSLQEESFTVDPVTF